MRGYRKLHIDNEEWGYRVGKEFLTVKSPKGERRSYNLSRVTGITDIDRERWKSGGPQVTPAQVKVWVENHQQEFEK